jgi:transcriptional regulator with XRE-family HTH domain
MHRIIMKPAEISQALRSNIERYKTQRNTSYRQLAIDAGFDPSTLTRFMTGSTDNLSLHSIGLLAENMNTSLAELLGETMPAGRYRPNAARLLYVMENMPDDLQDAIAEFAERMSPKA